LRRRSRLRRADLRLERGQPLLVLLFRLLELAPQVVDLLLDGLRVVLRERGRGSKYRTHDHDGCVK